MTNVVPARIEERLAESLDKMVQRGLYASRSDAVREAVRKLVTNVLSPLTRERLETVAKASVSVIKNSAANAVTDIILFGSVARGDPDEDSDIDLLILVQNSEDPDKMTFTFLKAIHGITLETDTVVTPTVMRRSDFLRMIRKGYGFAKEVTKEGVQLTGNLLERRSFTVPKKG